jgi:phage tail protein X
MTRSATLFLIALSAASAGAQAGSDYTVREGDTCARIARRVYGNSRRYDRIHEANPQLGPMPHRLEPGSTLHLPEGESEQGAEATLTAVRRRVQRRSPRATDWGRARVGHTVDEGWRVSTGARSSAELTFRTSSIAHVREETLVIIYGGEARRERIEGRRAVLRQGAILSRLDELSGGEPLQVETPSAAATLGAGEASVRVGANGDTVVAVHSGRAAIVSTPTGEGAMRVPAGTGTSVPQGGRPSRPRRLPRAPLWTAGPRRFMGIAGVGGHVQGTWRPVGNARTYQVEVARRPDGRDQIFGAEVDASITAFELHDVPPGTYYLRVSTIDRQRFEGRPGRAEPFEVVEIPLLRPGQVEAAEGTEEEARAAALAAADAQLPGADDPDYDEARPPPAVPQHSVVRPPEGVACGLAGAGTVREIRLTELGESEVRCEEDGTPLGAVTVDVRATTVRVLDAAGEPVEALPFQETQRLRLVLDPPLDVAGLQAVAEDGLLLTPAEEPAAAEGTLLLDALGQTPGARTVMVVAGDLPLARATVTVGEPPPPPEPQPEPPTDVPPPRTPERFEGFGLGALPSAVGLRDERREGSSMWLSAALDGEPGPLQARIVAGVRAALLDDYLRLDAQVPLVVGRDPDDTPNYDGGRDLFVAASSRFFAEGAVALAAELGLWTPTAGDQGLDRARLQVGVEGSLRLLDDRLALRTRQAGIFDLADYARFPGDVPTPASALWASAYGADLHVVGPLLVALEVDLTLGSEAGAFAAAVALGGGVAVDFDGVQLSLAGRVGVGDQVFFGRGSGILAVRGTHDIF